MVEGGGAAAGRAGAAAPAADANPLEEYERRHQDIDKIPFCNRLGYLFCHSIFMMLALGYAAQNFVVGAFAYFGVQYVETVLHFSVANAGFAFGLLTVVTGILGIWFGGWWVDSLRSDVLHDDHASTERALKALVIASCAAIPFAASSFMVGTKFPVAFFLLIAPTEFFLFATVAPANAAFMWCVEPLYKSFAVAMSVFLQHALGDTLSPIIVGSLIDQTGNMTLSLLIASCWLIFSALLFGVAWVMVLRQNDALRRDAILAAAEAVVAEASQGAGRADSGSASPSYA